MIVYKGTDKDMKCRGFQFELGKEYVEEEAKLCNKGFHGCEYPLEVFAHYAPVGSRFFVADLDGVMYETESDDTKRVGTKIKLKAEIGIAGIVKAAVEYIKERAESSNNQTGNCSVAANTSDRSAATNTGNCSVATNTGYRSAATNTGDCSAATNTGNCSAATNTGDRSAVTNTGDRSAATNTGDRSAATNTGNCSVATNTGYRSAATNTGDCSAATNTGNCSAATNTGDRSAVTNTGDRSAATNTGDRSAATNTGNCSVAANTGDRSAAIVDGKDSIAIVIGADSKASGAIGCWLVLTERGDWNGDTCPVKEVRAVKVDGEIIKPGVFYKLENGEVVEA